MFLYYLGNDPHKALKMARNLDEITRAKKAINKLEAISKIKEMNKVTNQTKKLSKTLTLSKTKNKIKTGQKTSLKNQLLSFITAEEACK